MAVHGCERSTNDRHRPTLTYAAVQSQTAVTVGLAAYFPRRQLLSFHLRSRAIGLQYTLPCVRLRQHIDITDRFLGIIQNHL